jgi:hypothetical protein
MMSYQKCGQRPAAKHHAGQESLPKACPTSTSVVWMGAKGEPMITPTPTPFSNNPSFEHTHRRAIRDSSGQSVFLGHHQTSTNMDT